MTLLALTFPVILASGIGTIFSIIVAIFFIVGAIKNAGSKGQQRSGHIPPHRGARPNAGGNVPTADDLAARRRAQLQELARQRQAGARPSAPQRPSNLSVGEAQARDAARRAYEQRQAELQRASEDELNRQRAAQAAQERQAQLAQQRQTQLARQAQASRRAQARPAARAPQRPPQRATRATRQPITIIDTRPAPVHELGRGATDVSFGPNEDIDAGEAYVHRHVADAAQVTAPHLLHHKALLLTRESLRQAFIVKEVLEPPVSMREG